LPAWIPSERKAGWDRLSTTLPRVVQEYAMGDAGMWSSWITCQEPEADGSWPPSLAKPVSGFHKLLLVQALRPDRLRTAMAEYAARRLNEKSINPPPANMKDMVAATSPEEPLLFVVTPGSDPCQELNELAARTVGSSNLIELAMGQGQMELALQLLSECAREGKWLCLKNVHLVVSWLPKLEQEIFSLAGGSSSSTSGGRGVTGSASEHNTSSSSSSSSTLLHPNFRLFMTTEPHAAFPSSLLEHSIKITFEAPPGLRNNMTRTLEEWGEETVQAGTGLRAKLLFGLAWFHAVLQERRGYIPFGWSKFYEFSGADLRSGLDIIDLGTRGGRPIDWPYLHGLLETAVYGGKIDNDHDMQILTDLLHSLFNSAVIEGQDGRIRPLPGTSDVTVPVGTSWRDMKDLVSNRLPATDPPSLFSLPANVRRALEQVTSGRVLTQLRTLESRKRASIGYDQERWRVTLSPLIRAWNAIVAGSTTLQSVTSQRYAGSTSSGGGGGGGGSAALLAAAHGGGSYEARPVASMLSLEVSLASRLARTIHTFLCSLSAVVNGGDPLTAEVESVGLALMADTVPSTWDAEWEGPATPLAYVVAVANKTDAVHRLRDAAKSVHMRSAGGGGGGMSSSVGVSPFGDAIKLSDFFNPGSLLNALRQEAAGDLGVPMDTLVLRSVWDAEHVAMVTMTTVPIKVSDLMICGANFDGLRLQSVSSDAPTLACLPGTTLGWVPGDQPGPFRASLTIPVYQDTTRSTVVCRLELPVGDQDARRQWVMAGVAVVLGE